MELEQFKSKTLDKINAYTENKNNISLKISGKRNKINELLVEYELEEQAYLTNLDEGAFNRMKEIKQEITGLEFEIERLEDVLSNEKTLALTDEDRQELAESFKKTSEKRDKLFNEFLKKKSEVIAAYNHLKTEHEQVNDLYLEVLNLVEIDLGREEYHKLKAVLPHKQNGDVIQEVKDMFEQCASLKENPSWFR